MRLWVARDRKSSWGSGYTVSTKKPKLMDDEYWDSADSAEYSETGVVSKVLKKIKLTYGESKQIELTVTEVQK